VSFIKQFIIAIKLNIRKSYWL